MIIKRVYVFALLLVLSACFKDEEYDTQLILMPSIQDASGGDYLPYAGCVAYAFVADTAVWEIRSLADALAGVMTLREDSDITMQPIASAVGYEEDGLDVGTMLSMQVEAEKPIIVIANDSEGIYAWRFFSVGLNLSKTYLDVIFRSWKTADYTENSWNYFITTPLD